MQKQNKDNRLKAIILSCFVTDCDQLQLSLPSSGFQTPDIAVSESGCDNGYLRILAKDYRVYSVADKSELFLRLNSYDMMIVYPLSLNTLAKCALGISDSFPSQLFFNFAQLAKPILISDEHIPDVKDSMNPHLIKTYKKHFDNLLCGTISSFNQDNIEKKAAAILRNQQKPNPMSSSKTFITKEDIISASQSLQPLIIPYGSVVTDLAFEEAEKLAVTIQYQ